MKIFSFIFSFYILFLTVLPLLQDLDFISAQQTESCCGSSCEPIEEEQPAQPSDNKEDSDNKACNPFQSCKCCIVFNKDFAFLASTPVFLVAKQKTSCTEKIPPQITVDFWQPPKIARHLI